MSIDCSSGSWLLSGRLAKMLLIDCEQSDCSMTLSGMFSNFSSYFHPSLYFNLMVLSLVPLWYALNDFYVCVWDNWMILCIENNHNILWELTLASDHTVLDFTVNLLETGLENDTVLALIVFSLQYVLVNHEFWKYKVKTARWKVTQKVSATFLLPTFLWSFLSPIYL